MTGPPLARVAPSDPVACPTGVVCVPVRANPPQGTASKLLEAVDKQSRIRRSFASDSATNLHFYNGILRRLPGRPRESAETDVIGYPLAIAVGRSARLLSFAAWSAVVGGNGEAVYPARVAG